MPGQLYHADWHWTWSIFPISCYLFALLCATCVLAFPPTKRIHRKLAICLIAIPIWYGFRYSDHVSYDYMVNDTFARTCIIWISHASYEICVLEFKPTLPCKESGGSSLAEKRAEVSERIYQARKVLNDRNHVQVAQQKGQFLPIASDPTNGEVKYVATDKKSDEIVKIPTRISHGVPIPEGYRHGYTRWRFVRYHFIKWLVLQCLQYMYIAYESNWSPMAIYEDENEASFTTAGLALFHVYCNLEDTFDWCVGSIMLYDAWHSVFAVFFVATGLDEPQEWSLALFGNIKNAWSVRRYWSRHWHNFIYHSFNGHIQCVTRGWLGMRRGDLSTRLIENTGVFFLSGLMHSAIRWQEAPWSDVWAITVWYTAQMVPITIETFCIPIYTRLKRCLANRMQFKEDAKWVVRLEYAFGYLWVFNWLIWSIPAYYNLRNHWTEIRLEKRRIESGNLAAAGNETG